MLVDLQSVYPIYEIAVHPRQQASSIWRFSNISILLIVIAVVVAAIVVCVMRFAACCCLAT